MSLTTIVPTPVNPISGVQWGAEPCAATDGFVVASATMEFLNDGNTRLKIENAGASPCVVGFTFPSSSYGGVQYVQASGLGGSVPAGKGRFFGPFPTSLNDANGKIQLTLSYLTSVFVAALQG